MISVARLSSIAKSEVGPSVFEKLVAIYPEGVHAARPDFFSAELPEVDPRMVDLIRTLESNGFHRWNPRAGMGESKNEYSLYWTRVYEEPDFVDCQFMEISGGNPHHVFEAGRDRHGLTRLLDGWLEEGLDFAFTQPYCWFVSNRVKTVLERHHLKGLFFRPTLLAEGFADRSDAPLIAWEGYREPWWEIESSITLPRLSDSMLFMDSDHRRVLKDIDYSNGYQRVDDKYLHAELHYRRRDLEAFSDVDVARTMEAFTNGKCYERDWSPIVVSRRFYEICRQHRFKVEFIPVRIDPDGSEGEVVSAAKSSSGSDADLFLMAVASRDKAIVRAAIDAGSDVNAVGGKGVPPIFLAVGLRDEALVELLIAAGADVNARERKMGLTPLMTAAMAGELAIVKSLVSAGARLEESWSGPNDTALSFAMRRNRWTVAQFLLDSGANPNVHIEPNDAPVDQRNLSPLIYAVSVNNLPFVSTLIRCGANLDHVKSDGLTALQCACFLGNNEAVNLLLNAGANPSAGRQGNDQNKSPLNMARVRCSPEVVARLEELAQRPKSETGE